MYNVNEPFCFSSCAWTVIRLLSPMSLVLLIECNFFITLQAVHIWRVDKLPVSKKFYVPQLLYVVIKDI